MKPEEALSYYEIKGAVNEIAPFGLGHINDTYLIKVDHGDAYLLQKVNTKVFRYAEILEHNIRFALDQHPELFPRHYLSKHGNIHVIYDDVCWRLQAFLPNDYSPNEVHSEEAVQSVGSGFGQFANAFAGIPPDQFKETIPQFHDLRLRMFQLEKAVELNVANRLERASSLVLKAMSYKWIVDRFDELLLSGLPKRLCHNDAKAANILIDKADDSFSKIIDLDTIGPGYLLYDYGDLMRSLFTLAPENETDLEKLIVRPEYFKTLKKAYLKELKFEISASELDSLEFGGLYMTYIMAIRFLTDYLQGDVYYKVGFENENMIRARNQFRLLELMNEALE